MSAAVRLHATAVAIVAGGGWHAVLLTGASGRGKSDLALRLIDRGAVLVADDQVELRGCGDRLLAAPPPAIAGRLEVRGVGIVTVPHRAGVPVALLVDLDLAPERMPEAASRMLAGYPVPCLGLDPHVASAPLKVERALTAFGLGVEPPP